MTYRIASLAQSYAKSNTLSSSLFLSEQSGGMIIIIFLD